MAGECIAVVGRSGAGKSTFLTILGLLDQPDAGMVSFLGEDVSGIPPAALARRRRGRIGYLFQDAGLIARMRVLDTVCLPMRYAGRAADDRKAAAYKALDAVELSEKANRRVEELSGGERQRVGLARALALGPQLLVCDEPSAALDEQTTGVIGRLLSDHANRGGCVILATHDPLLMPIADRMIRFTNGAAIEEAKP